MLILCMCICLSCIYFLGSRFRYFIENEADMLETGDWWSWISAMLYWVFNIGLALIVSGIAMMSGLSAIVHLAMFMKPKESGSGGYLH